jgi:adenosylcobinamide kinase/adenosylcobinamide-phosphate guanylyltransferase
MADAAHDPSAMQVVRSELVLGGQRSGKSRRAEQLAATWLAGAPQRRAVMIATATAYDDEMRARIARHRRDRAERLSGMLTVEEPVALAAAISQHASAQTLIVVDCLTLWLTALLMPAEEQTGGPAGPARDAAVQQAVEAVAEAVSCSAGPVVLVTNEIGLGVVPMGREVRAFVDAQGRLNQRMAAVCRRVTLMAAGLPLILKEMA